MYKLVFYSGFSLVLLVNQQTYFRFSASRARFRRVPVESLEDESTVFVQSERNTSTPNTVVVSSYAHVSKIKIEIPRMYFVNVFLFGKMLRISSEKKKDYGSYVHKLSSYECRGYRCYFCGCCFFNFSYQLFQCAYPVQYVVPAAPMKQSSKATTAKPVEKEVSPRNREGEGGGMVSKDLGCDTM